jgi:hypothetical protein
LGVQASEEREAMSHETTERKELVKLWRECPETMPELGYIDLRIQSPHADPLGAHVGDMKDCGDWTTTYGGTRTHHEVAALARDRLTELLGWIQIGPLLEGGYSVAKVGLNRAPTRLLALIAAWRAVKGNE